MPTKTDPPPKTPEEHRELLEQFVRLELFFLHLWLERNPDEAFDYAIGKRVDVIKTSHGWENDPFPQTDPRWTHDAGAVKAIYLAHLADRAGFEEEAMRFFLPAIGQCYLRSFEAMNRVPVRPCGSLFCGASLESDGSFHFHIANAVAPHSIFDDSQYLPGCFRKLLDIAESLGARTLSTNTWLNSYPRWLALFPQEWRDNRQPYHEINCSYGCWGQFINGRLCFNYKHGAILRATCDFPFRQRASSCTVAAMRKHLG